jgi:hypothetical protein
LEFIFWPEIALAVGSALIIKFPTDYTLPHNGIVCYVDYVNATPCYTYPDAKWILLDGLPIALTDHIEYRITVQNLINPKHVIASQSLNVVVIDSNKKETEYMISEKLEKLDPGAITPVNVFANSVAANNIDIIYTWIFTLKNDIDVEGSIILTFPKDIYNLNTNPSPTCEISASLADESDAKKIKCEFYANVVTITQFAKYTKGTELFIKILHVQNPSEITYADPFKIETRSEVGLVQDANYDIPGIQIESPLPICQIRHLEFYGNPSNGYS